MRVFLCVVDKSGGESFEELRWPAGVRLPCVGEGLLIGPDEHRIVHVQWELRQGTGLEESVQIQAELQ